jgi:hypothetical protein
MAKKKALTTVIVNQVSTVELTKRTTKNSLSLEVRSGKELLGTLLLGRGSVQWWPKGNTTNGFSKNWKSFVRLLESAIEK